MPTLQEFITTIVDDYAPDWSRVRIRGFIDRAQKSWFNQDCAQMTFLNRSDPNFPVPIINTTAETLEYGVTAANLVDTEGNAVPLTVNGKTVTIRSVKRVFISVIAGSQFNYEQVFRGTQFEWAGLNLNWTRRLSRASFETVPCDLFDKTNDDVAKVIFAEDPGTHDDRFYCEAYYQAPTLTSESIAPFIDLDTWQDGMLETVLSYIEDIRNGNTKRSAEVLRVWKPAFRRAQNRHMTAKKSLSVKNRECG